MSEKKERIAFFDTKPYDRKTPWTKPSSTGCAMPAWK